MRSPGPVILGVPVGVISRLAGLSLLLGLVQAIIPQDSADRLGLLLALRRTSKESVPQAGQHYPPPSSGHSRPVRGHPDMPGITVVGDLAESPEK
jgi:hypothetical protein